MLPKQALFDGETRLELHAWETEPTYLAFQQRTANLHMAFSCDILSLVLSHPSLKGIASYISKPFFFLVFRLAARQTSFFR